MSFVETLLGDIKGNQIILPHATWETFIAKRALYWETIWLYSQPHLHHCRFEIWL